MFDLRVLRVAVPAVLLALIVVAFSLENRPEPLRTSFSADAFQAPRVVRDVGVFAARFRDRRPGGGDDVALAEVVATRLGRLFPGVQVRRSSVRAPTIDGDRDLVTVRAQQPGTMPGGQLVVVAPRDAAARGGAADLSGTAAMLELARVFSRSRPRRSITFASVSGGSGGQGGIRDLVQRLDRPIDALIEIGDIGGPAIRSPAIVGWSDTAGAAPQRLVRTLALALRTRAQTDGGAPQARAQLARFAFPLSLSGQGVALRDGLAAVRLSMSGEGPPSPRAGVDAGRAGRVGQALLSALTALDGGPDVPAEVSRDLVVSRKVIPGWALRLLIGVLLLAPLAMIADAVTRLRQRQPGLRAGLSQVLAHTFPVVLAFVLVRVVALLGLFNVTAPPAPPGAVPFDVRGALALACGVLALVLGAVLVRPGIQRRRAAFPGAGSPLTLAPVAVVVACASAWWLVNPYAALVLVLPCYLWLVVAGRVVHPRRGPAVAAVLVSLLPAAVLLQSVAAQLGTGLGNAPWFAFLALAGGQGGLLASLAWALALGAAAAALRAAWDAGTTDAARPVTVRGPVSYAGPGSLGGTRSARRR